MNLKHSLLRVAIFALIGAMILAACGNGGYSAKANPTTVPPTQVVAGATVIAAGNTNTPTPTTPPTAVGSVTFIPPILGADELALTQTAIAAGNTNTPTPNPTVTFTPTATFTATATIPVIATTAVPPSNTPPAPVVITTSLPNSVDGIRIDDTANMPTWLSTNVGGNPSQWHLITEQNYFGWQFYAKDGSGNAVLCANQGEIHFGVWNSSTQWWDAAIINNGACTYAKKGEPTGIVAVDEARWYLYTLPTAARVDQMDGISVTNLVEFPKWLSQHIGGQPDQWGIVLYEGTNQFIGWEFDSRPGTGNGTNAKLCIALGQGQLSFGTYNLGGWWDSVTMENGCTYAYSNDPSSTTSIDNARWFPPFK